MLISFPDGFSFGYEFGKVATSMLQGNGYANPWGGNTGPTAAVLPVLVYLHYFAFLLFGKTLATYIFLSLFKFTAFALTYYFILKSFKLNNIKINYVIYSGLFLLFMSFSPTIIFKHTGDLWIYIFLVAWFLFSLSYYFNKNRRNGTINLLFFYFISPMINPAVALAGLCVFGIIYLVRTFQNEEIKSFSITKNIRVIFLGKNLYTHIRNVIIYPLVFSIPILIWSYRNYIAFDLFIPTKSNLWMEYYLANMKDDDGLLSYSTVLLYHPSGNDSIKEIITNQGEIAVMEDFKTIGKAHQKLFRGKYMLNTLNRFSNAFVFTNYDYNIVFSKSFNSFEEQDQIILVENGLIIRNYWVCLDKSDEEILNTMTNLHVLNMSLVYNDWKSAKQKYYSEKNSIRTIIRGLIMGIISTLALLFLLINKKSRANLLIQSSVLFYFIYIIPYILFSHQLRYQRPLFSIQFILIYCLIYYFSSKFKSRFFKINWIP